MFITAFETYYEVLKNDFPELDIGCFIKKPISLSDLAIRLKAELER
jgi:two-component system catabolic regulation response regulator CreB/two-component system response regulator ChvI